MCFSLSQPLSLGTLSTPPPSHPPGKHQWYQLDMMHVGPQSQSARFDEEKNSFPLAEVELRFLGFATRSLITMRMTLPPLRFNTSFISEKVIVFVVTSVRFNYCMYCVAYLCLLICVWKLVRGVLFFWSRLVFVCIPPLISNDHSLIACLMFAVYHTHRRS
jgi:hypothetical protein